ncbi:helix-turn-helix domain-containing protein [Synechococcus sp. MU1625]|uniref:helix-turn-helix domain-containing protein n=1 Tax=Synechococcus sp. MU1625 TaxID=2508347 RepID=UPI001CF7F029|nr:helix-turn-helix domain-containing protein [Synechococcus sp. MU1625]MCB4400252.1 helix-turn-helix domain-containing protein [Synechococcus sp. MU1625]
MAPRRLSDSEKQDLVGRYKAGESTAALAEAFGCSPNTVSRTVKSLLPADAYAALKATRLKGSTASTPVKPVIQAEPEAPAVASPQKEPEEDSLTGDESSLALEDADDFGEDAEEELNEDDDIGITETFTELVPLVGVGDLSDRPLNQAQPFSVDLLPDSAYMLVDKVVELDARPLKEFPELGFLDDAEQTRQGLCLFASPREAKRQCGRSQRVIKVPDTAVFQRTSSYLLARGITRLVLDGTLIALDA